MVWLLLVFALVASGCGGSSSSPAGPTPDAPAFSSLTVTGGAQPAAIGATVQLVATLRTNSATTDVTTQSAWQSSDEGVARVSSAGLVTTTALGTVAISATSQGQTGVARLFVTVGSGVIGGCASLTGSGTFTLASDLQAVMVPCVTFAGGVSATLDCQGHDAGSISLSSVQSFTVRNCLMHGALDNGSLSRNLSVNASAAVTIDHVDVAGSATLSTCGGCTVSHSSLAYPPSGHGARCTEVLLTRGHDNQLIGNTIDGGWDGVAATWGTQGCDDAVLISDEARPVIQGNVILHAYDCGIEAVGSTVVAGAVIRDNTIGHAGFAGIGAWYVPGWRDSVFSGNTISDSPDLLTLFVDPIGAKARGFVIDGVTLVNNQFLENTFVNPTATHLGTYDASAYVNMNSNFIGIVDNNLFRGNRFGTTTAGPILMPVLGFVDGGGNVCQPSDALASCHGALATGFAAAFPLRLFTPARPPRPAR